MKKIVIANWKMNPVKVSIAKKLLEDIEKRLKNKSVDVVICPPFPFINLIKSKKILVGAQNLASEKEGSFTGEVSGSMLSSVGVSYVIVGHSERRNMGETSDMVSKKVQLALNSKIIPIICIGEKARDNSAEHWQEIKWQLVDSLQGINKSQIKKCIIAYEPLWAISKKSYSPMKPEDISESVIFIRKILSEIYGVNIAQAIRVIYGGSVNPTNSSSIMNSDAVSGILLGHASLSAKDFVNIVLN